MRLECAIGPALLGLASHGTHLALPDRALSGAHEGRQRTLQGPKRTESKNPRISSKRAETCFGSAL
jgi:hypothetical protein